MKGVYIACLAFWLVVLTVILPRVTPMLPAWWWYDVRDVRVDSDTLVVSIDRDIRRDFEGDISVRMRAVVEAGSASVCKGGDRLDVPFTRGAAYPSTLRSGEPRTLAWFMDVPPNPGCYLPAGSSWVADFTWTWRPIRLFPGLALQASRSSNIFKVTEGRDL